MECVTCSGLKDKSHYHIVVEDGRVTSVWLVSADGFWDRELEKDGYFVEYKEVWLTPKLYQGKSMCELGTCDCDQSGCVCCK